MRPCFGWRGPKRCRRPLTKLSSRLQLQTDLSLPPPFLTPEKLKNTYGAQTIFSLKLKSQEGLEEIATRLRAHAGISGAEITPDGLRVQADNAEGLLPELIAAIRVCGLRDLSITEPSLETVFIRLTGRDLRE